MQRNAMALCLAVVAVACAGSILWLSGDKGVVDPESPRAVPKEGILTPLLPSEGRSPSVAAGPLTRKEMVGAKAFFVRMPPTQDSGDALAYVESRLAASSSGDGFASLEIHLRASACRRAIAPGDQGVYAAYGAAGMAQQYMLGVEQALSNCASLLGNRELLDVNWLERAARQGAVEAQLLYAQDPRSALGSFQDVVANPDSLLAYRHDAVANLESAIDTGSLDALEALGNIYGRGILAPQDLPASYAYKHALQRIEPSASRSNELDAIRRRLSPEQVAVADRHAAGLLKRCCTH